MLDTRFPVSVQIMLTLAYHQEELTSSEVLARVVKTNPTFIRKLVTRLVEAGLVTSFRGKGGGIRLARAPKEISLKDIYIASLEARPLLCNPKKPVTKACPVSCCMDNILCEIVDGVENSTKSYLSKKTLGDLLKQVK